MKRMRKAVVLCAALLLAVALPAVLPGFTDPAQISAAYARADDGIDGTQSPLVAGWDFEQIAADGKVQDVSGNGVTGTAIKADIDFVLADDAPSEGWGYARWLPMTESDKPYVYDEARASTVFYAAGKYEMLYDDAAFFNRLDDFSFSAWVKFASVPAPNVNPYIKSAWLFKADRRAFLDSYNGFGFDFGFAGQQTFYSPPALLEGCLHTSNHMPVKSEWVNYTVTVGSGMYRLYINGEITKIVLSGKGSDDEVLRAPAGSTPIKYAHKFDVITLGGGQQTGPQFGTVFRPADMFIDNACFYDKALSADEIRAVMDGNVTLQAAPQEDDGAPAEDSGCGSLAAMPASAAAFSAAAAAVCLIVKRRARA